MRYIVLPVTSYRTPGRNAFANTSWQVVDHDAGLNDRMYPRIVVASCRDETDARRICDMFNGGIDLQNRGHVEQALQKWQDKCTELMAERDEARKHRDANGAALIESQRLLRDEYARLHGTPHGARFGSPDGLISDHQQLCALTYRVWKLEQAK